MQALKSGPAVPSWLAASLISLVIGGAGGFYASQWKSNGGLSAQAAPPSPGGGGMGGGMGGMGGGMGGMGGGQQRPNASSLLRTVGALNTVEKARGKELTGEQRTRLAGVLTSLKGDQKLTEEQCEAKLTEIKAVLNPEQQSLLEEMTARPGGRGGPGGGPGGGANGPRPGGSAANGPSSRGGGYPAAGMGGGMGGMGGGMGGMGGGPDMERPFAEGRGKERLEELLTLLEK